MAVQNSEVDFDDPTYMRIMDVVSPSSEPTAMKKRGTIYSELDELWPPRDGSGPDHLDTSRTGPGGAGEVTAGGGASEELKGATKQEELVCCSQIDLGVDTDTDSEGEVAVTGPQVIRQAHGLAAVLSGEDADAAIPITPQRRVVSMALSDDIYRGSSFFDSLSPDFRIVPYPPAMFGQDGFAPVSCGDNPFDPSSKTILKAKDRDELEESLRNFADSLIRSEPPPMYYSGQQKVSSASLSGSSSDAERPLSPNPIFRPPMLPPLHPDAPENERKRWHVLESLMMSESAFLISLTTVVNNYMLPLKEAAEGPSPILDQRSIATLCGPIEDILEEHKLFYLALTQQAIEWNRDSTIGVIFISSFYRKPAIHNYRQYIVNFPAAMDVLAKGVQKKLKFVNFLKKQLKSDVSHLSLQALLLKPVQRFPQYLLFLQDFLKYTPERHPDNLSLQMALSHFESIAEHLDEAKAEKDHESLLNYLRLKGLPYKLSDYKGKLIRQQEVTKVSFQNDVVVRKSRYLLLFASRLVCAAKKEGRESSSALRGTEEAEEKYVSRWVQPLGAVDVLEPDYESSSGAPEFAEYEMICKALRREHQELQEDVTSLKEVVYRLEGLHKEYQSLDIELFKSYLKALNVMVAKNKAMIRQYEAARLDLSIPSKDTLRKLRRTYTFPSSAEKMQFVEELRRAKLRSLPQNKCAWLVSPDHDEEELLQPTSRRLPLYVQSMQWRMLSGDLAVECAVHTGYNTVWVASGTPKASEIAIIECRTTKPCMTECFPVPDRRILSMVYVPAQQREAEMSATEDEEASQRAKEVPTVWVGCQDGRLLVYRSNAAVKQCFQETQLLDAVTTLIYYAGKVFAGDAAGHVSVFTRSTEDNTWMLDNPHTTPLKPVPIRYGCVVKPYVWFGSQSNICVIHPHTLNVQTYIRVGDDPAQHVKKMVPVGAGVWVALNKSPKLRLLHKTTHQVLQEVDVGSNLKPVLGSVDPMHQLKCDVVKITSLLASPGYLWVGLSCGLIMIYQIPRLGGVPTIVSRPFVAMDAHVTGVRMMIHVNTSAVIEKEQMTKMIEEKHDEVDGLVHSSISQKMHEMEVHAQESRQALCTGGTEEGSGNGGTLTLTASDSFISYSDDDSFEDASMEFSGQPPHTPEGRNEGTVQGSSSVSQAGGARSTSTSSQQQDGREEKLRKEIGHSISSYHSRYSSSQYETLNSDAVQQTGRVITTEDLYTPVNPADLTVYYRPAVATDDSNSTHFVLTGGRGLQDLRQLQRKGSKDTITDEDTDSYLLIYNIPNL